MPGVPPPLECHPVLLLHSSNTGTDHCGVSEEGAREEGGGRKEGRKGGREGRKEEGGRGGGGRGKRE